MRDFIQGQSILQAVIDASDKCNGAIFLFMKDKETVGTMSQALPSNNVTFEAGYFVATKSKGRVLIIKEQGSVMPADLGGDIYLNLEDRDKVGDLCKVGEFVERNF
ncbi:MAG: nucleotide-binding protein [Saprospiraceae bacterium]|nr:nucleotide-binding protein [Saprospiraceae bacterium]